MPLSEVLAEFVGSPASYAVVFILGALFGSFANVCIYRLPPSDEHPDGRSVVTPASHCFACGKSIRWYDNIPLLAYLWLRGRCRDCRAQFSPRYLIVELLAATLFVLLFHHAAATAAPVQTQLSLFGYWAAYAFVLLTITFIDLDHKLILNKITYPAIPLFYGLSVLLGFGWQRGLIGLAVGYGLIRAISDGFYYLTGREGMGYGDGKLLAIVGAVSGWQGVLFALFLGSMVGSVVGVGAVLISRARGPDVDLAAGDESSGEIDETPIRRVEVPFGPFLALGAVMFLFAESWLRLSFAPLWGL
jgi:leader peptidase (prepilin peptidase)/N-methyltransferase